MVNSLNDQVVLITGGASGLGEAIVQRFVAEGAKLLVLDKSAEKLDNLAAKFDESSVKTFAGDVRSITDNNDAVSACIEHFGKLDCAIGNAGLWDFSTPLDGIADADIDKSFDELFHVNVKGYLNLAKATLPALVRSQGSILFTVSNAGFYPNGGGPLYTASKHAVVGLIRQLGFEFAPHVRVNGVAPGPIDTDLKGLAALGMSDMSIGALNIGELAAPAMPIQKVPSPEEYAGAYVFYASRRDNIPATGGVLMCDAGIGVRGIGAVAGGLDLAEKYK